jgi:hypothetical protein
MITTLDEACQLHERIHVLYVVSGYQADLLSGDGSTFVQRGEGETIFDAMEDLETKVAASEFKDITDLRGRCREQVQASFYGSTYRINPENK